MYGADTIGKVVDPSYFTLHVLQTRLDYPEREAVQDDAIMILAPQLPSLLTALPFVMPISGDAKKQTKQAETSDTPVTREMQEQALGSEEDLIKIILSLLISSIAKVIEKCIIPGTNTWRRWGRGLRFYANCNLIPCSWKSMWITWWVRSFVPTCIGALLRNISSFSQQGQIASRERICGAVLAVLRCLPQHWLSPYTAPMMTLGRSAYSMVWTIRRTSTFYAMKWMKIIMTQNTGRRMNTLVMRRNAIRRLKQCWWKEMCVFVTFVLNILKLNSRIIIC